MQNSELQIFNLLRQDITATGMLVLGSWAVLNILVFALVWVRKTGSTTGYFAQMNVLWNLVNLALAVSGWLDATATPEVALSLAETVREQFSIEKILLFNAGLDAGYIMTGFFLQEKAKTDSKRPLLLKGYGMALALQGIFLAIFDLLLCWLHSQHAAELYGLL